MIANDIERSITFYQEVLNMTRYESLQAHLSTQPYTWLVTGVAGFIGSNILETLLKLDQRVVGLDSFVTGYKRNLEEVKNQVTPTQWSNFDFIEGDIRNLADCQKAMSWRPSSQVTTDSSMVIDPIPVNHVLHQAALGSVPRSLSDPIATNDTNISGFLNVLVAARDAKVDSFTYAASSSTYGDHPALPKIEDNIGKPLSPYAVTKYVNEIYAEVFARCYGFNTIGLRYFNVFGPRQDPDGAYAAVIPKWTAALLAGEPVHINGDGETSRDFCFVANAVQANLLAATASTYCCSVTQKKVSIQETLNQVYNVGVGDRTTLNDLFMLLRQNLAHHEVSQHTKPIYRDFRLGDVRHSLADIRKAKERLGFTPTHRISQGLEIAVPWYVKQHR